MPVRVVRFTDVTPDRIEALKQRVSDRTGPPEGVTATGVTFYHDADQQTAIVIQDFATREDLEQSEAALEGMDAGETPGTRASVDRCEQIARLDA